MLADFENNARFPIELGIALLVFNGVFDAPYIADPNSLSIGPVKDRYCGKFRRRSCFGKGADAELARAPLGNQATTGQFGILALDRAEHIVCRYSARAHRSRIEPYAHFAFSPANQLDRTDAGHALQSLFHLLISKSGQVADGHVA